MSPVFEAISLSKTFRRWWSRQEVQALQDVNCAVAPGTVFGLLGPNGAGKTTLVKIALTIANGDSGEVRLLGESNRNRSILRRVGYLPENPRFPAHLTARQTLRRKKKRLRKRFEVARTSRPRPVARRARFEIFKRHE